MQELEGEPIAHNDNGLDPFTSLFRALTDPNSPAMQAIRRVEAIHKGVEAKIRRGELPANTDVNALVKKIIDDSE